MFSSACGRLAANFPRQKRRGCPRRKRPRLPSQLRARGRCRRPTATDAEATPRRPKTLLRWALCTSSVLASTRAWSPSSPSSCPSFSRMDVFVWPFLLLAAALIGGLGLGTASAGRRRRSRGWSRPGRRHRRLYRPVENGPARRGASMPCRFKAGDRRGRPARRTEQRLGQERVRKQDQRARRRT